MDPNIGMIKLRSHCPSCRHRISPLALECPICGLPLERKALPRPLLFQASALHSKPAAEPTQIAISAPALGRVTPIEVPELPASPSTFLRPSLEALPPILGFRPESPSSAASPDDSFWPLVRLEVLEALCLLAINALLVCLAAWQLKSSPTRIYGEFWHFLIPVHFAVSWAFEMVPLTLTGQSPLMGSLGLLLDSAQPERRIAFSLLHLCSVLAFPVSFFCMVLTPGHRTLGETLSGQEILMRPLPRMR